MKKIICLLLTISLLFLTACSNENKEDEIKETIVENKEQISDINNEYYVNQLNDKELRYYELFKNASVDGNNYIKGSFKFNKNDFNKALKAFSYDYPEYYWWRNNLSTTYNSSGFETVSSISKEEINNKINELQIKKDEIINLCKDENNYKTVKNIHDYLVNNVKYDKSDDDAHTIVGSLLKGNAVCDGYSLAYKYLLNEAGFNCIVIEGQAIENKDLVEHAWNCVELNNEWYEVDATWDDASSKEDNLNIVYDYFLINSKMLNNDHFPIEDFVYPECKDDSLLYINSAGKYFDIYDFDEISEYISKWIENGYYDFYLRFNNYEDGLLAYTELLENNKFADIFKQTKKNFNIGYSGEFNPNSCVLHINYSNEED